MILKSNQVYTFWDSLFWLLISPIFCILEVVDPLCGVITFGKYKPCLSLEFVRYICIIRNKLIEYEGQYGNGNRKNTK